VPARATSSGEPSSDDAPRAPTVCVFAPSPLLTVTIESRPDSDGAMTEGDEIHVHSGGQGFWVARMLAALHVDVVLCGSFGGELGQITRLLIEQRGIRVAGITTRTHNGGYIHDRRAGDRTELARSYCGPLDRHDVDSLYGSALVEGLRADVTVLTGPAERTILPDDIYRRLAADIGANGGRVIADLSGSRLRAALAGGLHLAKVSDEELGRDRPGVTDRDADVVSARELCGAGARHVVVSCAERGAVACLDGDIYRLTAPTFIPFDTRGAGDSMTAAVAASVAREEPILDAVRRGVAAGALNVTRRGLGSGVEHQIARITDLVRIELLEEGGCR
jgi:1-phosphofructokinase